jgi:hypothetical protein
MVIEPDWVNIYKFSDDRDKIRRMRDATLGPTDFGVSAEPALVGEPAWWRALDSGVLPRTVEEGTVSTVRWGSMGDWPEFDLTDYSGHTTTWTRLGDITRYVEGLRVRVVYTRQKWKVSQSHLGLGEASTIVLSIYIEASDKRSDSRAPGPFGLAARRVRP